MQGRLWPMRLAYADPPYLGCAHRYPEHPNAGIWNNPDTHAECIAALDREFDAWAFSLSGPSLHSILPLAPAGVRVAVWVKPFASFKRGVDPAYTWEPVIYRTVREWSREQPTCKDHHIANITLKKGLCGAKPESFCLWLFDLLGARPGDEFTDLFPGTGAVGRAWETFAALALPPEQQNKPAETP
jgi:hypothetical protein